MGCSAQCHCGILNDGRTLPRHCSEGFRPAVMVPRGKICRVPDQPLLGYGVGSGMLNGLKDGGRVGKPVANAPDNQRFKGGRRDSLAPALAPVDPSSNDREM